MTRRMVVAVVVAAVSASGCYVVATPGGFAAGVAVSAPTLAYIPGTEVQVVENAPDDVLYYDGFYWRYYSGSWWRSTYWAGGWGVVGAVPTVFLSIPPTHPKYWVVRHHPAYRPHPGVRPVPGRPMGRPPARVQPQPPVRRTVPTTR